MKVRDIKVESGPTKVYERPSSPMSVREADRSGAIPKAVGNIDNFLKTIDDIGNEAAKQGLGFDVDDVKYSEAVKAANNRLKDFDGVTDDRRRQEIDDIYINEFGGTEDKAKEIRREQDNLPADIIGGMKTGIDTLANAGGSVLDFAWDNIVGGLGGGLMDLATGGNQHWQDTFRNMFDGEDLAVIPDIAMDLGLAAIPGVGIPLVVGKNLIQQSDNISEAMTGVDSVTGESLNDNQRLGKGLGAALSVGLSALPGVGKAINIGKESKRLVNAADKMADIDDAYGKAINTSINEAAPIDNAIRRSPIGSDVADKAVLLGQDNKIPKEVIDSINKGRDRAGLKKLNSNAEIPQEMIDKVNSARSKRGLDSLSDVRTIRSLNEADKGLQGVRANKNLSDDLVRIRATPHIPREGETAGDIIRNIAEYAKSTPGKYAESFRKQRSEGLKKAKDLWRLPTESERDAASKAISDASDALKDKVRGTNEYKKAKADLKEAKANEKDLDRHPIRAARAAISAHNPVTAMRRPIGMSEEQFKTMQEALKSSPRDQPKWDLIKGMGKQALLNTGVSVPAVALSDMGETGYDLPTATMDFINRARSNPESMMPLLLPMGTKGLARRMPQPSGRSLMQNKAEYNFPAVRAGAGVDALQNMYEGYIPDSGYSDEEQLQRMRSLLASMQAEG